jgi:hypothetical protein
VFGMFLTNVVLGIFWLERWFPPKNRMRYNLFLRRSPPSNLPPTSGGAIALATCPQTRP